jgi:pimeloyl-ACP methyl ester carboxylesterase
MDKKAGLYLKNLLGKRANYFLIENSGHHIYIDNHIEFNQLIIEIARKKC